MAARAALIEVFASIQGEGRFVGAPMVFVRTATCPIRCLYCDTPNSYQAVAEFEVRAASGSRAESNPVDAEGAAAIALEVGGATRVVSLTGGEPLVYPEFAREFAERLRGLGAATHLETAALDPAAMARVAPFVDHVSADYKLPGTLREGDHSAAHVASIEAAAAESCSIDVKLVLTEAVSEDAVRDAFSALAPWRDRILLVLQPVTPFGAVERALPAETLARVTSLASRECFEFRVIPQIHPVLGVD